MDYLKKLSYDLDIEEEDCLMNQKEDTQIDRMSYDLDIEEEDFFMTQIQKKKIVL